MCNNLRLKIFAVHTLSDVTGQMINFEQPSYTIIETDSNEVYNLIITKSVESQSTYSITLRDFGGRADTPLDYTLPTNVFLFQPDQENFAYPITIVEDDRIEITEYFDITLTSSSSLSNVSLVLSPITVRIFNIDDDGGKLITKI